MAVTVGELKGYWKKVADAVSSNKMNVTDTDILAALMAIGQTIEDVEAEIRAIKSTEGIKKIANTVDVKLTGSKVEILKPFDKLEIRDASSKNTTVDLTNMRILAVVAMSTLDKPVYLGQRSLAIESTPASIGYWNGTGKWVGGFPPTGSTPPTPNDGYAVIQPNEKVLLTTFWPHLLGLQAIPYGFFARCYEAPTSGSLSVWVWGGPIV